MRAKNTCVLIIHQKLYKMAATKKKLLRKTVSKILLLQKNTIFMSQLDCEGDCWSIICPGHSLVPSSHCSDLPVRWNFPTISLSVPKSSD